jgi:phytol kinase
VPILVLTFADAVAALVGVRYGQHKYQATGGRKSIEGSSAFFLAAFFSAHVPLLLASDLGRPETLLIGITFGLLLTMVEAVAWSGLDNLFIPIVGYLLLKTYVKLPADELVWRLAVTFLLSVIAWLARGRLWNDAGLILAILFGYACANLGGWEWLAVAAIVFVAVAWLSPDRDLAPVRTVREVGAVCAVGMIWLGIANQLDRPELLSPFAGSFAAHLTMIRVARHARRPTRATPGRVAFECVFDAAFVLVVYLLVERESRLAWMGAAGSAVGTTLATILFVVLLSSRARRYGIDGRWWLQSVLAALASLGGLAVYLVSD